MIESSQLEGPLFYAAQEIDRARIAEVKGEMWKHAAVLLVQDEPRLSRWDVLQAVLEHWRTHTKDNSYAQLLFQDAISDFPADYRKAMKGRK